MNYIGSKHSLLPFIERVYRRVADGDERTFCDLFAGTGAVGRHFKRAGLRVVANDIQQYAYALNKAYLEINTPPRFAGLRKEFRREIDDTASPARAPHQRVLDFVNRLPGERGFLARHYSPVGNRFYYTRENAERADAIRRHVERWRAGGVITEKEYYYLIASLIEAADRVANTASVYGAFLKQFKKSARREMLLKPLALSGVVRGCRVYREDANALIEKIRCDVLYLDPPYNHRQYGANYHVLETVAAYDDPQLRGVTGMREYTPSLYCKPKTAGAALEHIIVSARARHILISYNDEGILSLDDVRDALRRRGEPKLFRTAYSRFKADSGRRYKRDATVEYLHYVRVTREG